MAGLQSSLDHVRANAPKKLTPENYEKWHENLLTIADNYNVLDLVTGIEKIKPEPLYKSYEMSGKPASSSRMSSASDIKHQATRLEHDLDRAAWKRQAKRIRIAYSIIILSIGEDMVDMICGEETPYHAVQAVRCLVLNEARPRPKVTIAEPDKAAYD